MRVDHIFSDFVGYTIVNPMHKTPLPVNFACLKSLIDTYDKNCGKMQDYDLKYVKYFVEACEELPVPSDASELITKVVRVCQK